MTRRLKRLACAGLVAAALPAMAAEVIETTTRVQGDFIRLLEAIIERL